MGFFFTQIKYSPVLVAACVLASASYPPIPVDKTTPHQQRIAINGANGMLEPRLPISIDCWIMSNDSPSAISVGWNTYQQITQPCVQYGLSSTALTSQACSTSSITYPTSRTWSNSAILSDLKPATTYYYKIVSTNSSIEHFLSPRTPGDKTSFSMNAVIDLGVYGEDGYTINMDGTKRDTIPLVMPSLNHTTIGRLASTIDHYELVVHPGDFAYADDWFLRLKNVFDGKNAYEAILENFYDQLAPISARKPYMVSPGNHEAHCEEIPFASSLCPTGQTNFTDFMNRFGNTMPTAFASTSPNSIVKVLANKAKLLANPPFWYSFEYGMVHVVMFNTETDFANAPDGPGTILNGGPFGAANQQLEFLEADLASVDRTVTPWIVVGGHRPWYSTGGLGCKPCQAAFEPILYKYGVDLAIFGHVHNSQRFLPVYNGVADPNGMNNPRAPVYIVAGGAGNIEGLIPVGAKPAFNAFAYDDDFSYATVKFIDSNNLQIDFIRSSTGAVLDSSVLYKAHKAHNKLFVVQP